MPLQPTRAAIRSFNFQFRSQLGGGTRNLVPENVADNLPLFFRAPLRCEMKSSFASLSVDGTYVAPAAMVRVRSREKAEPPPMMARSGKLAERSCRSA